MVKDRSTRQVTFSKRGTGLFKKANELATLCAAQIVITVFSPGGKPFSFGHLNVESVVSLFLNRYEPRWTASSSEGEGDTDSNAALAVIQDCNGHDAREAKLRRMREILGRLRVQDQEREALNRRLRSKELEDSMYKPSIDELGHNKLVEYKESLEGLRSRLVERMHEIKASQSLLLLADGPMNNRTFEPLVDRIKINRNVREMGVVFLKLCDFK